MYPLCVLVLWLTSIGAFCMVLQEERDKLFDVVEKGDLDKVNEMLSVMKHDVNTRHPEYVS